MEYQMMDMLNLHQIHMQRFKNSSGQALVLVLLSLSVVLTLVLFILSRTVTDVAISSREEEAIRAFSAAEAGVERALVIGSSIGNTTLGDANFSANVTGFGQGVSELVHPLDLFSNDSLKLWFVSHDPATGNLICNGLNPCFSGNTVRVCWGKQGAASGAPTTPAVEVSFVYATSPGDYSTLRIARGVYDPNSGRRPMNAFSAPDSGTCNVGGTIFQFYKTINLSADLGIPALPDNGLQYLQVKSLYNTDVKNPIGFSVNFAGNDPLPSQGLFVNSTGTSGEANRRLEVFQSWPEPPQIFESVIFSTSGITK
mgnify:FL=1